LQDFFKTIQYCHREACPVISTIIKEYQTVLEPVTSIGYYKFCKLFIDLWILIRMSQYRIVISWKFYNFPKIQFINGACLFHHNGMLECWNIGDKGGSQTS